MERTTRYEISTPDTPATEEHKRVIWTVWLGPETQGEYTSDDEATQAARQLAAKTDRPMWRRPDRGYPLIPIEP